MPRLHHDRVHGHEDWWVRQVLVGLLVLADELVLVPDLGVDRTIAEVAQHPSHGLRYRSGEGIECLVEEVLFPDRRRGDFAVVRHANRRELGEFIEVSSRKYFSRIGVAEISP